VELEETDHRTGRPIRTIELVEQSDVKTEEILAAEATVGDDTAARSPIPLVERARVPSCRRETSAGIGSAELPVWTCDRQTPLIAGSRRVSHGKRANANARGITFTGALRRAIANSARYRFQIVRTEAPVLTRATSRRPTTASRSSGTQAVITPSSAIT
jgi:hypothetical protein